MRDFALTHTAAGADLKITNGDIAVTDTIDSAVAASILIDARAATAGAGEDPRGWWADSIGSRLWQLSRSKITPALLREAETACVECLQWAIDAKDAASVTAAAERSGITGRIDITVTVSTPAGATIAGNFTI